MKQSGPCCICGTRDYELSMGGPSICPACDCGHFSGATVLMQAKIIEQLRSALRGIAEYCSEDGTPFGAIGRLATIRSTAERALRGEVR